MAVIQGFYEFGMVPIASGAILDRRGASAEVNADPLRLGLTAEGAPVDAGASLPPHVRSSFEAAFGADFSQVRERSASLLVHLHEERSRPIGFLLAHHAKRVADVQLSQEMVQIFLRAVAFCSRSQGERHYRA